MGKFATLLLFFVVGSSIVSFGSQVQLTLDGTSGQIAYNANVGTFYTGPYEFNTGPGTTDFWTMCFDAAHEISFGVPYPTDVYQVSTIVGGNVPTEFASNYTPPAGATLTQVYEAEAYLADQLFSAGYPNLQSIEIQYAAWALFDPAGGWDNASSGEGAYYTANNSNAITNQAFATAVLGLENAALANAINNNPAQIDYSNYIVYSPIPDQNGYVGQGQIELVGSPTGNGGPPTPLAPEPASLALFGSGLIALGGVARKRIKANKRE